ncbi:MAG TPA: F0F1 ATP synthase subunit alpha, partial [Phycisphaerae bacterium]|nr:F0F1 ATP synthase subunit alpha [Phycisphaerae bacterium]
RQLDRGIRLTELLKQPQYAPMDVIDQILSIHAGVRGFLDDLPIAQVREFETELLKHYRDEFPEVRAQLARERKLTDEIDAKLKEIVGNFRTRFGSTRPAAAKS